MNAIKHCVRDGIEHGDADKTIENFTKAVERFSNMGVPSRFMRKFICRLRLNEVSRQ